MTHLNSYKYQLKYTSHLLYLHVKAFFISLGFFCYSIASISLHYSLPPLHYTHTLCATNMNFLSLYLMKKWLENTHNPSARLSTAVNESHYCELFYCITVFNCINEYSQQYTGFQSLVVGFTDMAARKCVNNTYIIIHQYFRHTTTKGEAVLKLVL